MSAFELTLKRHFASCRIVRVLAVASPGMGHWVTYPRPVEFDARKILQPFFASTYRPITHIKALITVTVAGCCKKKTLVVFVFTDLTPDGFHFWTTLSPRTSEPVRHASVPRPPGAKFWRRHWVLGLSPSDTIRYDTIRDAILTCARKPT